MAKYCINEDYIERYKEAIAQGEVIPLEIREEETRTFRNVKAILSFKEMGGAERITPVTKNNFRPKGEDMFIKILEDLPEEETPLSVWKDAWRWSQV